ncbi:MAG: hypothetical protein NT014_07900 [Candidatus Omnitrophica bacterium]|nr:hypothetical protein [Candidatus Omnitrophota bacterium]
MRLNIKSWLKNNGKIFLILIYFLFCGILNAQECNNFDNDLKNTGTKFALLVVSQAIDEYPIWSPDSNLIGVNIEGQWFKIDLNTVKLEKAEWRGGQRIGVIKSNKNYLNGITEKEIEEFKKTSKLHGMKIETNNKTIVELKRDGFGTYFILTKGKEKPKTLWVTDMENCYSLVLSPNEKYVAFICELNGLVVMKLD